ncbi:MAG: hypothetical protein EA364_00495 [Balneolaceae bacterium]|nr:MAG: hypothetical protein EA364_00495 [Balneolaceae bacterium]
MERRSAIQDCCYLIDAFRFATVPDPWIIFARFNVLPGFRDIFGYLHFFDYAFMFRNIQRYTCLNKTMMNILFIKRLAGKRICIALSVYSLCFLISGCAFTSNPEKSDGEIIAVPDGPWCSFSISADGRWLQYMGDESPLLNPDRRYANHQRETFLMDMETGEHHFAEPDPTVQQRIAEGLGPDGLGCFSPDNTALYFTTVDWGKSAQHDQPAGEVQTGSAPSSGIAVQSRQRPRYYYRVDLMTKPFVIREADGRMCAEEPGPVKPGIRVERPSDKRIEIYAADGRQLARHRPRAWFGNTISIWNLDQNQWEMDYSLSPDGKTLAYRISERGMIGFSAPTHGYLLRLSADESRGTDFLAASVYSMKWDPAGNFYACTSHSAHRRVIARWSR